ncbi:MAG TPA: AAA family ATPase, partial [Fibrella sp.]
MQIKRLVIENFKSIERIELIEPNPFTVFVGPNGSGKSNIFEAREFNNRASQTNLGEAIRLHGGPSKIGRRSNTEEKPLIFEYLFEDPSLPLTTYALRAQTSINIQQGKLREATQGGLQVRPSHLKQLLEEEGEKFD